MIVTEIPANCDALVLGSGAAGLVAALRLKKLRPRANVLLLEKTDKLGGTTSYSGGICWLPGHRFKSDPTADAEQARQYIRNICPDIEASTLEGFIADSPQVVEFLLAHGVGLEMIPGYPDYYSGAECSSTGRSLSPMVYKGSKQVRSLLRGVPKNYLPFTIKELMDWGLHRLGHWDKTLLAKRKLAGHQTNGRALVGSLTEACLEAGVNIALNANVEKLLVKNNAVEGVVSNGQTIVAPVVIMACGGFSHNPGLMKSLGDVRRPLSFAPEVCDTGGGLALALDAGLKVGNPDCWWMPAMKLYDEEKDQEKPGPDLWAYHPMIQDRAWPGGIMVNAEGKRFTNESACYMTVGEILAKDRDPMLDTVWLIWGQYYVKHYIRGNTSYLQPAKSYMHKSKSVAELAENIGLPEENLQETINHWNEMAAKGKDEDFGRGDLPYDRFMGDRFRDGHPNIEKVESPFQAVRVHPGCLGTNMGPVTDEHGRVQSENGNIVEGLYAAGNAAASIFANKYPGAGGTLGQATVFGFRSASHASRLL